jgi:homeobox protein cut-like
LPSLNINNNSNNNKNNPNSNLNNHTKINSFHDILTPIQQLKNINNKLNNSNPIINKPNSNEARPASTPSSASFFPASFQNVEQFSSMLGEEIVNNWRHSSFLDLPPPPSVTSTAPSTLAKLTTSMQNRMINQFPNFTDCLSQNQNHHHHHIQAPLQDIERNENSSAASTPILQEGRRSEELLSSRGVNTPSLPPLSKSPSEDNHPLLHNGGVGPLSLGLHQFHPFGERGNNPHYKFADELHLPLGSMVGRLGDSLIPKGDPMEARLQEMLRYNMDKYANQNLDTLHISRRVRELLSVHNIGQRIFAKYVLGLSQGTVSELLSKPKPWDKLTEKGRDSYRKMHAWALDDQAILLLKSLIPKKGKF